MEYNQIGFSNIRMPDDRNSRIYKYSIFNRFPEEVFVHEFLHTLERNEKENGNEIASLHDYKLYGYEEERYIGLKNWYKDYMQNTIENGKNAGLTKFAYISQPIHESDFTNITKLNNFDEPENLIGEIGTIIDRIKILISSYIERDKNASIRI